MGVDNQETMIMKLSRKAVGLTLFVTMALAGAACDAATTDGTSPGQEIPADDGLGTSDGMGGTGGDTGAGGTGTGGDTGMGG